MEDDRDRAAATFRFTILNISSITCPMLSPPCYVRNLPWKILIMRKIHENSLAFLVQCNRYNESTSWSCVATVELKLLSSGKPEQEPFVRKIQYEFNSKQCDWGYARFMNWNEMLDPKNGYIKDNSITVEVVIHASEPQSASGESRESECVGNETDVVSKARSEATLRFKVLNFDQMYNPIFSPAIYICNLPWKIHVIRNINTNTFGFFVQCNGDDRSMHWACYAAIELRLLSSGNPRREPIIRKVHHLFYSAENDWGISDFLPWNYVQDPRNGFIKDNSIDLEVHINTEKSQEVTNALWNDAASNPSQSTTMPSSNATVPEQLPKQSRKINITQRRYNERNRNPPKTAVSDPVIKNDKITVKNNVNSEDFTSCPLCTSSMTIPIYLCESGHSVCKNCHIQLPHCKLCMKKFTTIRNRALESLVELENNDSQNNQTDTVPSLSPIRISLKSINPCVNQSFGCTFASDTSSLNEHKSECHYRTVHCPNKGCDWMGHLILILEHFSQKHIKNIKVDKYIVTKVDLEATANEAQVFYFANSYFIYNFVVDVESNIASWIFLRYGSETGASKWLYDLEIVDTRPHVRRSVTMSGLFRSDDVYLEKAIRPGVCSTLSLSLIRSYLLEEDALTFRLHVWTKKKKRGATRTLIKIDRRTTGTNAVAFQVENKT